MRKYPEEGRSGVEGELDPAGLLLLFWTETCGEGGGQEHRPQSWSWAIGSAEKLVLGEQKLDSVQCKHSEQLLCLQQVAANVWNLSYLDIISIEDINSCWWKLCPINSPYCQNQRIRRDNRTVTSNRQLSTQLVDNSNEPNNRTQSTSET